ncbi:exo-alpha-sialidase [Solihabitans fulvus]|uniref:Exo-alpha-sialidase n=1 Tax=Solihabitans fulvus TaxID=1892852 RepID=A0A5B2WRF1_9PSEU|nr:sialidase family protein [Solihabitans fulvus]KAA2253558.1 exo-alpha-sialidase [Solihabitans fulvus]
MRRGLGGCCVLVLVLLASVLGGPVAVAGRSAAKVLGPNEAHYPRVIRLAHSGAANGRIVAAVVRDLNGVGGGEIFESADGGASFAQLGRIADPLGDNGVCCADLFELPSQVGSLRPGTLLWVGAFGEAARPVPVMSLRIWQSTDRGRTWSYLSACAEAADGRRLWEPELAVDAAGRLVCHFSDEGGEPGHNQVMARTVSTDGVRWTDRTLTVAVPQQRVRPGMPNVRRLPDGDFYLTYELCNQLGQYSCATYYRLSKNGWDWGDPADQGTLLRGRDGSYFMHTPTIALTPGGRLLLVGQELWTSDGHHAPGNGTTVFVNDSNGIGDWSAMPAPVPVPGARDDQCPNYSSTLLPVGGDVLEVATDYGADHVCRAWFASARLPAT